MQPITTHVDSRNAIDMGGVVQRFLHMSCWMKMQTKLRTKMLLLILTVRAILRQVGGEPRLAIESMLVVASGDMTVVLGNAPKGSMIDSLREMRTSFKKIIVDIAEASSALHAVSAVVSPLNPLNPCL